MGEINRNSLPSLVTFLLAVLVPALYGLGYFYSRQYFSALGCDWAINFLTPQEIIFQSTKVFLILLAGFIVAHLLSLNGKPFEKILKWFVLFIVILSVSAGVISWRWEGKYFLTTLAMIMAGATLLVGAYISDLLTTFQTNNKSEQDFSVFLCLLGTFTLICASSTLGGIEGRKLIQQPTEKLPQLVSISKESTSPGKIFLLAKVNDGYLVLIKSEDKQTHYLLSDLDNYQIIKAGSTDNPTPSPQ